MESDDIQFLRDLRDTVDKYLFLGFAPAQGSPGGDHEGVSGMQEAMRKPEFAALRQKINASKARAKAIFARCRINAIFVQCPPRAIGGPVIEQHIIDIVTQNLTWQRIEKEDIFDHFDEAIGALQSGMSALPMTPSTGSDGNSSFEQIILICKRFHAVASELRKRPRKRQALLIEDEYDAQYLILGLLKLRFDDVRPEEWTPSYAGASSRMDFLISEASVVLEIKMARKGLGAKEIGEQLIVDIEKYSKHPSCKYLVCLVYDPKEELQNPASIERDLSKKHDQLIVRVLVVPSR